MSKLSEPAYPFPFLHSADSPPGLSKRELFAAMAMQGLLANPWVAEACMKAKWDDVEKYPKWAVEHADGLLAKLEESP